MNEILQIKDFILQFAQPAWKILYEARQNKNILFEGAQGFLLDVEHGTYPYVTSSVTMPGQALNGSCVSYKAINYILGIAKAYTTRVGSGPFPTELANEIGRYLGEKGREFGTVTGRERRCGWFDTVLVRQAVQMCGIDGIALTKLDVLDELDEVKMCVGYKHKEKTYNYFPSCPTIQQELVPIYETMPGWKSNTHGCRVFEELPSNAQRYVQRIEELITTKIAVISTSPDRDDTILIENPYKM